MVPVPLKKYTTRMRNSRLRKASSSFDVEENREIALLYRRPLG